MNTRATLLELGEIIKRGQEAEVLLNRVLNWALANRGTKSEFVRCYTYGRSYPQTLADVKAFLREPRRRDFKVVSDEHAELQRDAEDLSLPVHQA